MSNAQQIIDAQAAEIKKLQAARTVPNTAAADMTAILELTNAALQTDKTELQSSKAELEAKNESLTRDISIFAQRNLFLDAELRSAAQLLQTNIPSERTAKQENLLLSVRNKTLDEQNAILVQKNIDLTHQQSILCQEHAHMNNFCKEWHDHAAQQAKEILDLRRIMFDMEESLKRKTYRLQAQKNVLDKAGLVVMDLEGNGVVGAKAGNVGGQAKGSKGRVILTPVSATAPNGNPWGITNTAPTPTQPAAQRHSSLPLAQAPNGGNGFITPWTATAPNSNAQGLGPGTSGVGNGAARTSGAQTSRTLAPLLTVQTTAPNGGAAYPNFRAYAPIAPAQPSPSVPQPKVFTGGEKQKEVEVVDLTMQEKNKGSDSGEMEVDVLSKVVEGKESDAVSNEMEIEVVDGEKSKEK